MHHHAHTDGLSMEFVYAIHAVRYPLGIEGNWGASELVGQTGDQGARLTVLAAHTLQACMGMSMGISMGMSTGVNRLGMGWSMWAMDLPNRAFPIS
ncbi:hypothetical protein EON63_14360 [archaeon]|nr:MAG: hypothetical protein EON63_14360 [archaeon]